MLQLFRSNQPLVAVLLFFLLVLLWAISLYSPLPATQEHVGLFSAIVLDKVGTQGVLPVIIAMCLVYIQALYINSTINGFGLAQEMTLFPALFYICFASFMPQLQVLSPELMGSTFVIVALQQLYKATKQNSAADNIFNIGFWIAVGGLFYLPVNMFLFFGLLGLAFLRGFRIDEVLILILGFFTFHFLLATYLLWNDQFGYFYTKYVFPQISFLSFNIELSWYNVTYLLFASTLVLFGLANSGAFFNRITSFAQKNLRMLFLLLGVALFSVFFQSKISIYHTLMFGVPIASFTAFNFINVKNRAVAEFLFISILVIIFAVQYQQGLLNILEK